MRRKRDLTSGSHIRPDKYLAMPRGLSAVTARTVRVAVVTLSMSLAGSALTTTNAPFKITLFFIKKPSQVITMLAVQVKEKEKQGEVK